MSIFVCVKHVPDSAATIRLVDCQRIDETITFLLNPYEEHALTAAVQLNDQLVEVVALSLGRRERTRPCVLPWPWERTARSGSRATVPTTPA